MQVEKYEGKLYKTRDANVIWNKICTQKQQQKLHSPLNRRRIIFIIIYVYNIVAKNVSTFRVRVCSHSYFAKDFIPITAYTIIIILKHIYG